MKFAISVPVGAWHDFLPKTLESLAAQKVDLSVAFLDASGDPRVRALADRFDSLLAYRRHGPDDGQSDAILEGWANLYGDWLGWLNADDILMPKALASVVARHNCEPDLDVIYGHSTILDKEGCMTGYHYNVEPPGERILHSGIISQPSCFFSRSAYKRAGELDRSLHYVMDWDLWIRLYKSGAKFGFIEEPLSMVLWGSGTKTASLNRRRRSELKAIIQAHAPEQVQKARNLDFAVHAMIDMAWPPFIKQKLVRRYRGVGQSVFGIRADGRLDVESKLVLAHYETEDKCGLQVQLSHDPGEVEVKCSEGDIEVRRDNGLLTLTSSTRFSKDKRVTVDMKLADSETPVYFRRACWRDC